MKKLLLLLFTFLQLNSIQSQNWEWETRPETFSKLSHIFPITKDKWIIAGRSAEKYENLNSAYNSESFLAIVDSTGTLWGKVSNEHVVDIKRVGNNLYVAVGTVDVNLIREIQRYKIEEDKLSYISVEYFVGINVLSHADAFAFDPNLVPSTINHLYDSNNILERVLFKTQGEGTYYFYDTKIYDFLSLGDNNFIVGGEITVDDKEYGIAKITGVSDYYFDFVEKGLESEIVDKIISIGNHYLVVADSTSIKQLDESLELISDYDFSHLGTYEDILLENQSIYLFTKNGKHQFQIHQFNLEFELIKEHSLYIPNSDNLESVHYKDGVFGIGASIYSHELDLNPKPSSMFLKVFDENELPDLAGTEIAIEKIRIPHYTIEKDSLCDEDLYHVNLSSVRLTIKNLGTQPVNELYVNFKFEHNYDDWNSCSYAAMSILFPIENKQFSEKIFNINLEPGQSTEIFLSDVLIHLLSPDIFEHLDLIPFCFSISSIDHSLDIDPSNNYFCENILIQHETITPTVDTKNPFVLFPNPTKGRLRIRILKNENSYSNIWISNALGQQLNLTTDFDNKLLIEFDVEDLPNGVYFVNFDDGKEIYSEKFIKQ